MLEPVANISLDRSSPPLVFSTFQYLLGHISSPLCCGREEHSFHPPGWQKIKMFDTAQYNRYDLVLQHSGVRNVTLLICLNPVKLGNKPPLSRTGKNIQSKSWFWGPFSLLKIDPKNEVETMEVFHLIRQIKWGKDSQTFSTYLWCTVTGKLHILF